MGIKNGRYERIWHKIWK